VLVMDWVGGEEGALCAGCSAVVYGCSMPQGFSERWGPVTLTRSQRGGVAMHVVLQAY
jgi:hypothetical protein